MEDVQIGKIETTLKDLERRIGRVEDHAQTEVAALHAMQISMAKIEGSLSVMRFTLPLIVGIGGVTVAFVALFK